MNDLDALHKRLRVAKQREMRLQAERESKQRELDVLKKECLEEFGVELSALLPLLNKKKEDLAVLMSSMEEALTILEGERANHVRRVTNVPVTESR